MHIKMRKFSYQGRNTAEGRDASTLMNCFQHSLDLFGRADELYDKVEDQDDVPSYIIAQCEQKGRIRYLLNRDGKKKRA